MKHIFITHTKEGKSIHQNVLTFVLMCVMTGLSINVSAQNFNIKGVITDASTNEPLAGAAVIIKGTTTGTSTDVDGNYGLKVKKGDILVCSFFGYENQEKTVGTSSEINFELVIDKNQLDDAVVVGYGTLKKTQLVGAVENLGGEELEGRMYSNVTRSLQGQIPGLNIAQVDGKPNHGGQIHVRGNSTSYKSRKSVGSAYGESHSIGQGTGALILIDGVEGSLSTVNPDDIETVSVLKDAASAAVYGAKGAYGVILVKTKSAKKGKVTVNYDGSFAINTRTTKWENEIVTDGLQWAEAFADFFTGNDRTPDFEGTFPSDIAYEIGFSKEYLEEFHRRREDPTYENYGNLYGQIGEGGNKKTVYYGSTNWLKMYLKDMNYSHNHNLSIRGGNDLGSFSVSGNFYNQDGIYKIGREVFKKYNIRAKGDINITKWMKLSNNTSLYSNLYHTPMVVNANYPLPFQVERRAQPVYPLYNEDGSLTYAAAAMCYDGWSKDLNYDETRRLTVNTTTALTIEPIKDILTFTADFTYKADRETKDRISPTQIGYTTPGVPKLYNPESYKSHWGYDTDYVSANIIGTWNQSFNDRHDFNFMLGWNIDKTRYRRNYQTRSNLLYPEKPSFELMDSQIVGLTDDGYDKSNVGFFGRLNYTLFKRYIFEFAARYDGSSLFPAGNRWGFFPSGSIGWRISEEPWMDWSNNWLNNLKLRANAGSLGNANISPYTYMELIGVGKSGILVNGEKVNITSAPGLIPSNLTWETVTTYDIGIDLDLFNNRLSGSFDYYWRTTDDLLIHGPEYPQILGTSSPKGNYGSLSTEGWELSLGWRDSFKAGGKPFDYNIKFSMWDSRTWVKAYNNMNGNIYDYYPGKELGEIWGFRTDGYFITNEEADNWVKNSFHKNGANHRAYAGDLKFLDINGDGQISAGQGTLKDHGDLERIGNLTPHLLYGINLGLKWNGIGLSLFFQGVGQRDWYPMNESGFFWGMYNRPYGYLPKVHVNDAVQMDYSTPNWKVTNPGAYYTRQVTYCANRNVGPLSFENDYYLQNASYFRLKNITLDYTFPKELTRKIYVEQLKIYVSADNLFTYSPMFKHTKMFDPECIDGGDPDYNKTQIGLGGVGQGYGYPMLKTITFGLNITF